MPYLFAVGGLSRRRGGIILMSSGAGLQGAPYYSHYAATRAYNIVLAESLWAEFKPHDVDVLACVAGMTLSTAAKGYQHLDTSEFQTTDELVLHACDHVAVPINDANELLLVDRALRERVGVVESDMNRSQIAGCRRAIFK